ncbi:MAG: DUF2007 domain-containing protein [Bacteroidales bacterium]|jgi:hypothetical protein|nr:DUF2007 domain-containing protein [Bacteroidales bacterium]
MENNWIKIYESPDDLKAEIVRQLLLENDIETVVINKKDRVYLIGDIEIYVNRDMVIQAKSMINKLHV